MLQEMRPSELGMWLAFNRIDPWGEHRGDIRMGILASLQANINRDPSKRPAAYEPLDFMPFVERPPENPQAELRARFAHRVKRKGN